MELGPLTAAHVTNRHEPLFSYEELERAQAARAARWAPFGRALARIRALLKPDARRDHLLASRVPAE